MTRRKGTEEGMETTPEKITELPEGSIFVFGSNASGSHGAGAAAIAVTKFGAVRGRGEGLQGQSYALPSMEGRQALQEAAERFVEFARSRPDLRFYLTKVGCGIAGYGEDVVAPMFAEAPDNVVKPPGW